MAPLGIAELQLGILRIFWRRRAELELGGPRFSFAMNCSYCSQPIHQLIPATSKGHVQHAPQHHHPDANHGPHIHRRPSPLQ